MKRRAPTALRQALAWSTGHRVRSQGSGVRKQEAAGSEQLAVLLSVIRYPGDLPP
ncbi:MAG: hypothetical protein IMF03_10755 [Proteobacteria bacterium]|nr:hypothetical protein [Pseudomonadota bacterium]